MFKHRNKGRTFLQNVRLAGLLSVVAGVVNIVGILWLKTLTTNITGHFAFFSEDLFTANYKLALISVLYLISFLMGAFLTNTSMEISSKGKRYFSYRAPLTMEIILLSMVAFSEVFFQRISCTHSLHTAASHGATKRSGYKGISLSGAHHSPDRDLY